MNSKIARELVKIAKEISAAGTIGWNLSIDGGNTGAVMYFTRTLTFGPYSLEYFTSLYERLEKELKRVLSEIKPYVKDVGELSFDSSGKFSMKVYVKFGGKRKNYENMMAILEKNHSVNDPIDTNIIVDAFDK